MKYQLILISDLRLMHQHVYSCIYELAEKYFLQDVGGKQITHYIYLKGMILLIINYLLVKKYSKLLNLNLFLQHTYTFRALLFKVINKNDHLKVKTTMYLRHHLFSES